MQRVAVVTGANRGLGKGVAEALARQGYRVVVAARNLEQAESVAQAIKAEGHEALPAQCDVADPDSVRTFLGFLEAALPHVDVLVNNAGAIFERAESESPATMDVAAETVRRAFETNTLGAFRLTQALLPGMNARRSGRVVNVSSGMGGLSDMGGSHPAYRVSKTALNAVTRIFHAEAGSNVKVNSVCPGWVRTDMGGPNATRELEEGIAGIVWAATLPEDGPSGGFFRDGKPIPW